MSKPYSEDLRERVVAAVEGGLSRRQAAGVFDVARLFAGCSASAQQAAVQQWVATSSRHDAVGGRARRPSRNHNAAIPHKSTMRVEWAGISHRKLPRCPRGFWSVCGECPGGLARERTRLAAATSEEYIVE